MCMCVYIYIYIAVELAGRQQDGMARDREVLEHRHVGSLSLSLSLFVSLSLSLSLSIYIYIINSRTARRYVDECGTTMGLGQLASGIQHSVLHT